MTSPNANDISFLTEATEANATHDAIDLTAWMSNVTQIQNTDTQTPGVLHRLKATRLGKFYLKYLKKYPLIRWLVVTLWRTGFPIYLKINVLSLSISDYGVLRKQKLRVTRRRKLIAFSKFCNDHRVPVIWLFDTDRTTIPKPDVFPASDQDCLAAPHTHLPFPEIIIGKISDALINGGSNLVLSEESVICHDLYDFRRDSTSEELHGRAIINPTLNHLRWLAHDKKPETLAEAASFVDACAGNYAHWLTEVLPRINLFCVENQFKHIPVIINAGLHQNILESLFLVAGSERKIITLDLGRAIYIKNLYLTSVTGYVPFDVRSNKVKGNSHGLFSPQALISCRNAVLGHPNNLSNQPSPEKIFIRRNSGTRQITNADALEKLLIRYGYVIIEPEKLSFLQQIRFFRNARQIISSTGAALANGIFCQEGTQVGILMGKHDNMIYRYWANMLAPLQIRTSYVLGEIVRNQALGIHGDFFIDEQHIHELLTSWKT